MELVAGFATFEEWMTLAGVFAVFGVTAIVCAILRPEEW